MGIFSAQVGKVPILFRDNSFGSSRFCRNFAVRKQEIHSRNDKNKVINPSRKAHKKQT